MTDFHSLSSLGALRWSSPLKPATSAGPRPPFEAATPTESYVSTPPSVSHPAEVRCEPVGRTNLQRLGLTMVGLASTLGALGGLAPATASAAETQQVQAQSAQTEGVRAPALLMQVETPLLPADAQTAAAVVQSRQGTVLSQGRMLKYDFYPGLHNARLQSTKDPQPQIPGGANFRKINGEQTYGVAQPTVPALKQILTRLGAGPGNSGPEVKWTTLRQEPVIYVHGRSLTVRQLAHPFANLEQPGISGDQVETQERQLKQEILQESQRYGGRLLVQDETPDGQVVARWVEVGPEDVQTPREVFDGLRSQGFRVDYARVPVTDEKAPDDAAVDALVARLKDVGPDTPLVFNCHAGRGRTTTGMIIGDMLRHAHDDPPMPFLRQGSIRQDIRETGRYQRGEYRSILALIKALENGPQTKAEADALIDRSSAMQNLREAIEPLKNESETGSAHAPSAAERGKDYLYRYSRLITVDAYIHDQAPQGYPKPFSQWLQEHPELQISRDSLELAMGLHTSDSAFA